MSKLTTEILEYPLKIEVYSNDKTGKKYNLEPLLEWMDGDSFEIYIQRWIEDLNGIMLDFLRKREEIEIKYIVELAEIQYWLFYLKDCMNAMKVTSKGNN